MSGSGFEVLDRLVFDDTVGARGLVVGNPLPSYPRGQNAQKGRNCQNGSHSFAQDRRSARCVGDWTAGIRAVTSSQFTPLGHPAAQRDEFVFGRCIEPRAVTLRGDVEGRAARGRGSRSTGGPNHAPHRAGNGGGAGANEPDQASCSRDHGYPLPDLTPDARTRAGFHQGDFRQGCPGDQHLRPTRAELIELEVVGNIPD
jgi:hypothetical protein